MRGSRHDGLRASDRALWRPFIPILAAVYGCVRKKSIDVTLVTDVFLTLYKLKTLAPAGVFSVPGQQGCLF